MACDVRVAETEADLVDRAVALVQEQATEAIAARGRLVMALSGGSTPRPVYQRLAADLDVDWGRVHIAFCDERCVPLDNPLSNYRMVRETLIDQVPDLPASNVHPVPVDWGHPEDVARKYEEALCNAFGEGEDRAPQLDLAILGMGPDGHTASLFPRDEVWERCCGLVVACHAGMAPWVDRVSLMASVLNQARLPLMLVTGAEKAKVLSLVVKHGFEPWVRPASMIIGSPGHDAVWLVDREAARKLKL